MTTSSTISQALADDQPLHPSTNAYVLSGSVVNHPSDTGISWAPLIAKHIQQQTQPSAFVWAGRILKTAALASNKTAGKMAYKLWFTPQTRPISEQDKAWLASASQSSFNYKTYQLPLYEWGQGKTVLLVHGWGGHSGQFRQLAQALVNQGYQVMCFDAPGHGQAEGKTTNAEEISEIIQSLAKKYTFEGIVSHSIGGLSSHHALNAGVQTNFHGVLNTPMALLHVVEVFKHQLALSENIIDQHKHLMESKFGQGFWSDFDLRQQKYQLRQFYSYDDNDHQVAPEVGPYLEALYPAAQHHPTQGLGHNKAVRDEDVIRQLLNALQQK